MSLPLASTRLDYMQFGQQIAVSQRHFFSVQKLAAGDLDVLDAVVVDLVGQRRAEVLVQLLQRLQQPALQSCKGDTEVTQLYLYVTQLRELCNYVSFI